jgi:hypothetical protein
MILAAFALGQFMAAGFLNPLRSGLISFNFWHKDYFPGFPIKKTGRDLI